MERHPFIQQELIDWLKDIFPSLSINYKTPIEQIMYCSGQQSVIDYLQAVLNNSNNENLNKQIGSIE